MPIQFDLQHHTAEDLRHYQQQLERIDGARVDGVFCGNLEVGLPASLFCKLSWMPRL